MPFVVRDDELMVQLPVTEESYATITTHHAGDTFTFDAIYPADFLINGEPRISVDLASLPPDLRRVVRDGVKGPEGKSAVRRTSDRLSAEAARMLTHPLCTRVRLGQQLRIQVRNLTAMTVKTYFLGKVTDITLHNER